MHKEREGLGKQTPMQEAMRALEVRNSAEGEMLFATFGRGKSKALIFPTPAELKIGESMLLSDFLVVTSDGYKVIHIDNLNRREGDIGAEDFSLLVSQMLGKINNFFDFPGNGYKNGALTRKTISITPTNLLVFTGHPLGFRYSPVAFDNWRIMDASISQVGKILALNLKRVEYLRVTSQSISKFLNGTAS